MKQQNKKEPSVEEQIRPNAKQDMQARIRSLVKRREQHEARIDKLLGNAYPSRDATKESIKPASGSEFSQLLQQLDNNEPIHSEHLQESAATFGSHVNLLATVSLKTEYFLGEKEDKRARGQLVGSLKQEIGKCSISKGFVKEELQGDCSEGFRQMVQFLVEEELAEDLFTEAQSADRKSMDYFGTRFVMGKYQEVQLSMEGLQREEERLLSIVEYEDLKIVKIGKLLLSRLLSGVPQTTFPGMLHSLFSYPLKSFRVRESLQLIEFNELIKEMARKEEENKGKEEGSCLKIYGIQEKSGYSYQIQNLTNPKTIKHFTPILHRFPTLVLLHMQELPVKHMPLSCLQNHFVVVSMDVQARGQYFLSVGSSQRHTQFRVILLDSSGKSVQAEFLRGGEFMYCRLKPQQYQVYINPIPEEEVGIKDLQESYELVVESQQSFTLWIQSRHLYSMGGELQLQLRLKQQYNHYTLKIARLYLQNTSSQKEIQELQKDSVGNQILVRRDIISGLGLVLDSFVLKEYLGVSVIYKGSHMLADTFFQDNSVTISKGQSLVLYKPAQIEKVAIQRKGIKESLDFSLVQYYH